MGSNDRLERCHRVHAETETHVSMRLHSLIAHPVVPVIRPGEQNRKKKED